MSKTPTQRDGIQGSLDSGLEEARDQSAGNAWRSRIFALTAAAILLRLLLFLGRGDYMAFDEGWYLLLGRSLFTGDGYTLVGTPHITLSPLFPILAGGTGSLLGSWLWGGRVVAAVSSGLLILPAWAVFRRLAPPRTAFTAALFVAVLPTLAPFVAPFYIGADLWVGAEPLLHLFLFGGIALWLRARERGDGVSWLLTGMAFGLAFLARPEAIATWGLLGLATLGTAAIRRSPRILFGAVLMGLSFILSAAPYWSYIHGVTGEWHLTGRGVSPGSNAVRVITGAGRSGAPATIEGMLWRDDDTYIQRLYGLDETGLRLGSDYWGVYPGKASPSPSPAEDTLISGQEGSAPSGKAPSGQEGRGEDAPGVPGGAGQAQGSRGGDASDPPAVVPQTQGSRKEMGAGPREMTPEPENPEGALVPQPSFMELFAKSLGAIFPPILWPFALLGLMGPGDQRKPELEVPVLGALLGTSLAIALLVAVDPRTQLFLVPALAFLLARGFHLLSRTLDPWVQRRIPRPGFLRILLAGVTVAGLLGISLTRLYLGLAYGSPHHLVAQQNRLVAEELDTFFQAPEGPVASWHPALAVYADRDWRVLPYADIPAIIRYSQASGAGVMVLSGYYPPFRGEKIMGTRYLVLPVPQESAPEEGGWVLTPVRGDTLRGLGRLEPQG